MTQPTVQTINDKLKMQVKAKIAVSESIEGEEIAEYPIIATITKGDNESLYELRDFFRIEGETTTFDDPNDGYKTITRNKYKGVLVHEMKRTCNQADSLLRDEIVLRFKSVADMNSYLPQRIDSLVSAIRNAFVMQLQDNTIITVNFQ